MKIAFFSFLGIILKIHRIICFLSILLILLLVKSNVVSAQIFSKVNSSVINTTKGTAYGVGWIDFNNDGYLDIIVTNNGSKVNLFVNNKDGSFGLSDENIISNLSGGSGITWGDYDNDDDNDLFIIADEGENNILFDNLGNGNFLRNTSSAINSAPGKHMHCTWIDYDNDGWLDMFIPTVATFDFAKGGGTVNLLYHNNGDGSFTKISNNELTKEPGNNPCANFGDYDNDGDMDLFVTEWQKDNWLYENNGDGSFSKIIDTVINTNTSISSTSCWGDIDNDGDMDLFVGNGSDKKLLNQKNFLYKNNGNKTFTKVTTGDAVNIYASTFTSIFGDIDNDGDLDLFIGQFGDSNFVFTNDGTGNFSKVNAFDIISKETSGAGFGDYDNDGFLDLFVANVDAAGNTLYHNNRNNNNWINITCKGTLSNRSAIGARVKVKASIFGKSYWQIREINGNQGFRSFSDTRAHFGLGNATVIDSLVVEWPSKQRTIKTNVPINQFLEITEGVPVNYLKSGFKVDKVSGFSPLKVQFTETSICDNTNPIISRSWDFDGDGVEDSNEKDPSFIFDCYGGRTYSVSLTIKTASKEETIIKTNLIKVLPAYQENVAQSRKVTASSYLNEKLYPASNAVDGLAGTFWQSALPDSQWFQVELDSIYSIGQMALKWGTYFGKQYTLQFSKDGINWFNEININNGDGKADIFNVDKLEIKYIKVVLFKSSMDNKGYRLNEFEVYRPKLTGINKAGFKPTGFALHQNYPNPFNPETTISYQLSKPDKVELKIYDLLGREVATLVNTEQNAGNFQVKFNGSSLSSGIYLYRLKAGNLSETRKLILLR